MNKTDDCLNMHVDAVFIIETAVLFLTSICGIILNGVVLTLLPKFELFSCNVQILLQSLAVAALTACLAIFVRSFYNTAVIIFGFATLSVNNTVCALLDGTYVASRCALMLSVAAIGGERLHLTLRENYADYGDKKWAALIAALCAWILGTVNVILLIWNAAFRDFQVCYCYFSFTMSVSALSWAAGSYAFLEISVIIVYWYVYFVSRRRLTNFTINVARHCLHERYQMWNNVRTTAMLFPWILIHGAIYFVTLICMTFVVSSYRDTPSTFVVNCLLLILIIWTVDLILAPILWIRNNERFLNVALNRYPLLKYVVFLKNSDIQVHEPVVSQPETSRASSIRNFDFEMEKLSTSDDKHVTALLNVKFTVPNYNATIVEHRIEPEKSSEILQSIWATKRTKK